MDLALNNPRRLICNEITNDLILHNPHLQFCCVLILKLWVGGEGEGGEVTEVEWIK